MPRKTTRKADTRPASDDRRMLQFLVVLLETDPPIWRRIQVPIAYNFWDLHIAIQDAVGWTDSHLHEFRVWNPEWERTESLGIPSEDEDGQPDAASWAVPLLQVVQNSDMPILYTYDFGDNWRHVVAFEGIRLAEAPPDGPRCMAGARKCPPEDCGGIPGFESFLAIVGNKEHPEHESYLEWAGGSYDPEEFDPQSVVFTDPRDSLGRLLIAQATGAPMGGS